MPEECLKKMHDGHGTNCRDHVHDHCTSAEVKSAVSNELETAVSIELEAALSSDECEECAAAYARDGGCKHAVNGQWYKIRMPEECLKKMHDGHGTNCRDHVHDHCKSPEVKSAVSNELETAVSSEECEECAAAYARDGGCKHASN